MSEFKQQLHRNLPPTTVWGYSGTYSGPTFETLIDERAAVNWINNLPTVISLQSILQFMVQNGNTQRCARWCIFMAPTSRLKAMDIQRIGSLQGRMRSSSIPTSNGRGRCGAMEGV